MTRLRVLVLGPGCHPDRVSIPRVTYHHAAALAKLHDVTIAVRPSVEAPIRRDGAPFRAIEAVQTPRVDAAFTWWLRHILKENFNSQWRTAASYPLAVAFEREAWRQFRRRIRAGEFDVVFRVEPMSPSLPSPFAWSLRRGPTPFVLGPLNGGLPFPPGFPQIANARETISPFRNAYRNLPYARSTYKHAAAIIAASSQTYSEFASYAEKLFFVPEPGISESLCFAGRDEKGRKGALELLFVGGLVPRKACDLALSAAAPLLARGSARFTIIGDGPDRAKLEALARSLGIADRTEFTGWIAHAEVLKRMRSSDVFLFPTLRDNGAGVVFEALASGAIPVVVDFGGPGDTVHEGIGFKVPLTNEADVVTRLTEILERLADDQAQVARLRENGMAHARERLTWDAKAQDTARVLEWAAGRGPKPHLPPPKAVARDHPLPAPNGRGPRVAAPGSPG